MTPLPPMTRPHPRPAGRDVPSTTWAVLGMLTFGEMSGYDVGKLIDRSISRFGFQPARSQVYASLRRLVALGWATERAVTQRDRPDKRVYRVTTDGEQALRGWLESPTVEPEVVRSPFLLKVFLGARVPRETLLAQMKEAHRRAIEDLESLEEVEREIAASGRKDLRFPGLVVRYGLAHNRASVAWTADMLEELQPRPRRARTPAHERKGT
ncbi:MAG: PadR family transcriptional regulator [Actinomycetota bacterium]